MPTSSRRKASSRWAGRAEGDWCALSDEEKRAAARFAAVALTRQRFKGLPRNVVRLGFGPRHRRLRLRRGGFGKVRAYRDEPCLIVFVKQKLSPSGLAKRRAYRSVPDSVLFRVPTRRGRFVIVAIPTDVVQLPHVPKAQALVGVQVSDPDHSGVAAGSVAALVKVVGSTSGARFLLTCHHVAFPRLSDDDQGTSEPPDVDELPGHQNIGVSSKGAFFGYGVGPCVDAGLVRLTFGLPDSLVSPPVQPNSFVTTSEEIESEWVGVRLYSKHHAKGVAARYSWNIQEFDVRYESGKVARIVEVIQYELPGSSTRAGDSGGSLVSDSGTLLGMHIAGSGRVGYAIPAYKILRAPAFKPRVELDDRQ